MVIKMWITVFCAECQYLYVCIQGDGPKLVRELFRVAEEHAPSIVFIDEIDAIGTKRYCDLCRKLVFTFNHFINHDKVFDIS